jgi:hypothetical protein
MERFTDELFAPHYAVKNTRKVVVGGIDDVWGIDLMDMRHTSVPEWLKANDGYEYVFTCIDCFSRYVWCIPMKKKDMATSWACLETIMKTGRRPAKVWVDEGSEFYNKIWKTGLKELGIVEYSTYGKHKVSVVERVNRTLKHVLYPLLAKKNTYDWMAELNLVVDGYNARKHSALGMSPASASLKANEEMLWKHQYGDVASSFETTKAPKFKIGDFVRIFRDKKGVFERGFDPNWSRQVYVVASVGLDYPFVYGLRELPNNVDKGLDVDGVHYENDLLKTAWKYGEMLDVDRVVKSRKVGKKKEVLVRWLGWSAKYDSWIPA